MNSHLSHIQQKLDQRKAENALRELKVTEGLIDVCSNDYLGFAQESSIHKTDNELTQFGSTGSRLIRGNYLLNEEVESYLATYYKSEVSLIFNSGYTANVGLFSCIAQRGDTIIYDEYIHASIRDGIRLSYANSFSFKHNDLVSLEEKLKQAKGTIFVAIESIYSMDGDEAPLKEIIELMKKYQAALIVDEAHAVGVFGENGEGLVVRYGLEKDVFARVATFGKAFGCHGAAVLGNNLLRNYLINFSRAFIYTTALPLSSIQIIKNAHQFLENNTERIEKLKSNIEYFRKLAFNFQLSILNSRSAIQSIIIPGNNEVKQLAEAIQIKGFDVRPILSPTVPQGKERLRICLHTFNSKEQIEELLNVIGEEL